MLEKIINRIRADAGCVVYAPSGIPDIPNGYVLPPDILEFYRQCGGMELYPESSFGFRILPAEEVVQVNPLIVGELCEEDISSGWFVAAKDGNGNYISIDLRAGRKNGFCYDSSIECHGLVGDCAVVARCFSDLLVNLYVNKGKSIYWKESVFQELGDAYDGEAER